MFVHVHLAYTHVHAVNVVIIKCFSIFMFERIITRIFSVDKNFKIILIIGCLPEFVSSCKVVNGNKRLEYPQRGP